MWCILHTHRQVYREFTVRNGVPIVARTVLNTALQRLPLPLGGQFLTDAVTALLFVHSKPFYPWVAQIETVLELWETARGARWVDLLGEAARRALKYAGEGVAVVTSPYMDVGAWAPSRIEQPLRTVLCKECVELVAELQRMGPGTRLSVVFLTRDTWLAIERSLLYDMYAGRRMDTPRISKNSYLVAEFEGPTVPHYVAVGDAPLYVYPI